MSVHMRQLFYIAGLVGLSLLALYWAGLHHPQIWLLGILVAIGTVPLGLHYMRAQDRAARRALENELKFSKKQLELLDLLNAAVLKVDSAGRVSQLNNVEVFGYGTQGLNHLTIDQLAPNLFLQKIHQGRNVYTLSPDFPDGRRCETVGIDKNGRQFHAEVMAIKTVVDGENIWMVRVHDRTDRKALQQELLARQQHLETILSVVSAGMMSVDEQGKIKIHNGTAADVFRYTPGELKDVSIERLLPEIFFRSVAQDGQVSVIPKPEYVDTKTFNMPLKRKNDQEFPASITIRKIDLNGRPFHVVRVRDITHMVLAQDQLRLKQNRVEILLEATRAALFTVEEDGTIESHSASARKVFGYDASEFDKLTIEKIIPTAFSLNAGAVSLNPLFADNEMHDTTGIRKGNKEFPATVMAKKVKLKAEGKSLYVIRVRDTTERRRLEDELRSRKKYLETILDNAAEGILTFDERGAIESFNRAAEKLFGYREQDVIGQGINILMPPDTRERREGYLEHFMRAEINRLIGHEGEVVGRHKDGTKFPMALKVSVMVIDGRKVYTGLVANISERKAMVEHLKNMAEHDGLTGLYNRGYFQGELERVVERTKRSSGQPCALLYIDLDNFKYVNDTLGHGAGDHVLLEVAGILNKRARKSDLIARLGGDEFAVLLYNTKPDQASQVAEAFREQMSNYVFKQGADRIDIGCSIGVSLIGDVTKSAGEVMSQADIACHLAKRAGRNRVHIFKAADEKGLANMSLDMGWSRRIREAIKTNRFALACQPILNVSTGGVDSYEVLIRMVDDNNELIMPGGFMPSAERFGLMADIDKWVIANAIDTLVQQRQTVPHLRYSINLSGQTLSDPSVADLILAKLHATGLEPSALIFEVTETVAIADMKTAETFLARLQVIGCETALDDFGSGFSSFAYLRDLPVDTVKIDGRFVKNLAKNPVDQAMVKAMNDIAHALGKHTVAEFVENEESLQLLKEYGVDYAQGYHLGRPEVVMPCKAIADSAGRKGIAAAAE